MRSKKQWVCYRYYKRDDGSTDKFMISPVTGKVAYSNDSDTWADFESAEKYMRKRNLDGLAFVMSAGMVFTDLDHVVNEKGEVTDGLAREILAALSDTYAELSVSGSGIHIFCKGALAENARKRRSGTCVEMYDTKRFACVTGNVLNNRTQIKDYSGTIAELNKKWLGTREELGESRIALNDESDEKVIERIRNSPQRNKFDRLYGGDISGYDTHSEADAALASMLTFWTRDEWQIIRIIASSGLNRRKWQGGYAERTVRNALAFSTKYYKDYVMS